MGLCTFIPTTCPFILGLQTHHLSFLISQRRWRALKSTIWSLKGDEEPSNPPFWYLQGAVKPSNPPLVHLKLFKVLWSMYLQTHHMSIYLGSSNPPMKGPHIHYLSFLKEIKSPQIHHFDTSKGIVEPSNPLFWYLQGTVEPSNPPPVHLKLFKVLGSMYLQTHHMYIYHGSSNPPSLLFDLSKEMKSP